MQKRRNKPADTFMMDKEGFANRLKEMTVTGSTDAADSPLKKDCEIEKLDLSQVPESDVLNNAIETSMVGDNEMHPGNDDGKYSKQLMDTCSVDTIKEAPFDIVEDVEEMTKSKEPTADASDVDDSSITKEKINNRVDAQRDTEDDDSQIRKWSTATFSDANSVISELRADMHTDTSALISSSRKRAESDAKEIMDTQNEKRSQSYIKKEVSPIEFLRQ
ncbi:unnamed protein product [Toxocara canis]|uniref:Ovule protein n=1 Tax=Toxocara canis TaxID=6265 RepID=A0A183UQ16_TOXCA|nr:unnamed protein product [Toxocara canis]